MNERENEKRERCTDYYTHVYVCVHIRGREGGRGGCSYQ